MEGVSSMLRLQYEHLRQKTYKFGSTYSLIRFVRSDVLRARCHSPLTVEIRECSSPGSTLRAAESNWFIFLVASIFVIDWSIVSKIPLQNFGPLVTRSRDTWFRS
jgi:hypothetical protein